MPQIITDAMAKEGVTLNILLSISKPCLLSLLFGSVKVTSTIKTIIITKTHDILFKKGIGSIKPLVKVGKNLSNIESGMVSRAADIAALEVVFFQKKPNRKIAKTPGEIKPTYS